MDYVLEESAKPYRWIEYDFDDNWDLRGVVEADLMIELLLIKLYLKSLIKFLIVYLIRFKYW